MKLTFLNSISTCPLGGALMDGMTYNHLRGRLTCTCLLVETEQGLVLIDTGLGLEDVRDPRGRLSRFFLGLLSPDFRNEMTAVRQIESLGYDAQDVRHIVLSHLDFDHAGGLDDFPLATIHLMQLERDHATAQRTWLDRQRYRPQQWSSQKRWHIYSAKDGEPWYGFDAVRQLEGLPPEILLVPLIGHTFGHAGIAIKDKNGWVLNAADAYFYHAELDLRRPRCTPGLALYQRLMEKDRRARLANQERLRELKAAHSNQVEIFCSHDLREFERLSGRPAHIPIR